MKLNHKLIDIMNKKKHYERPVSVMTQVRLESPICSGSVQFGDVDHKVDINNQQVIYDEANDFSNEAWGVSNNNSTNSSF